MIELLIDFNDNEKKHLFYPVTSIAILSSSNSFNLV